MSMGGSVGSATRPRTRLSREETRAQTAARLLEAAREVFAERGFHGASVEDIAERAGYTRGAFYSNFESKDDVFLTLLDKRTEEGIAEVGAIFRDAPSRAAAFEQLRSRDARATDPTWRMLWAEFELYAMRNPKVRPKLAAITRVERDAYKSAIEVQFTELGVEPPGPLEDLALIVQVLDHGITHQRDINPRGVRSGFFFDALAMLLHAAVAASRERQRSQK